LLNKFTTILNKYDAWLITIFAFLLRIIGLHWMAYANNREFFRDYFASSIIAHGQRFLLYGPPSIIGVFHFGPIYYYILAIFQFVFRFSPSSLLIASMLISSLSVFVLYHLLLLWFKEKSAARIGAILCALSMYSIFLGEYVSNPNFVPLFLLWFFYTFTKILHGDKSEWTYLWAGLSFAIASQLHITAMILLSLMIITGIIWRKNIIHNVNGILVFIGVTLLVYSTYIYYQFTTHFSEFGQLIFFAAKKFGPESSSNILLALSRFVESVFLPIQNTEYAFTNLSPTFLYLIVAAVVFIFIFIFIKAIIQITDKDRLFANQNPLSISKEGKFIITFWTIFSLLILSGYHNFIRYYYLIILWPLPIIILVCAAYWLKNRYKVFYSFLAMFLVISVLEIFSFYYSESKIPWSSFNENYNNALKIKPNILEVGAPDIIIKYVK